MTCSALALCLTAAMGLTPTDGDSFSFQNPHPGTAGKTYVRVWGLNAPESDAPGGAEAEAVLADLIDLGPDEWLECAIVSGSYHRVVADCRRHGSTSITCAAIARGPAVEDREYSRGALGCETRPRRRPE